MKRVLISGICGGLGRALALKMREEGWEVIGLCRTLDERAKELGESFKKKNGHLEFKACNLANSQEVEGMGPWLKKLAPGLDAFAHLAAPRLSLQPIWRESHSAFQRHWQVGVGAGFQICSHLLRSMAERGNAHVLFVLSSAIQKKFPKGMAAYAVGKHSLLGLAEAIAAEYGDRISVHTLFPSVMNTSLLDDLPAAAREALVKTSPNGEYSRIESTVNEMVELLR